MMRAAFLAAAAALLLATPSAGAQVQGAAADARLRQSLDTKTYAAVTAVFESARARGLPLAPLVNRALQATLHRTPGPRVQHAVSSLADRLVVARESLGDASSEAELTAGANALAVGVPRETLTQIRALSPGQPVTVALGALFGRGRRSAIYTLRSIDNAASVGNLYSQEYKIDFL